MKRDLCVVVSIAGGFAIHLGTAALRFQTFLPYPRLLDFSAFYASAWALRRGLSPYGLSEELVRAIQVERAMPFRPPPIYNPPIWPWLLQPLTFVDSGTAAFIWLAVNLALLVWIAISLASIAGYESWQAKTIALLLASTFGPVFLDLSLGQTSVLLLALALEIGRGLWPRAKKLSLWAVLAQGVAAGVKLYPLVWLGAPLLLRRWRSMALGMLATLLVFGIGFLVTPQGNQEYWVHFLPGRVASASGRGGLDDQSLAAWLDRVGRAQSYTVPGLWAEERLTVVWSPPWSLSAEILRWSGYLVSALLGLPVLAVLIRAGSDKAEGGFYLWVLYTLLVLPHIERYNHALLLPVMAWLWGRDTRQRPVVALAYVLVGLSRLNHLWAILFSAPWGALSSGFGLYAVLLLGTGMTVSMWPACKDNSI